MEDDDVFMAARRSRLCLKWSAANEAHTLLGSLREIERGVARGHKERERERERER